VEKDKSAGLCRLLVTSVLALALLACNQPRSAKPDLRTIILAANTAQYCHSREACLNPHILSLESGYVVTTFIDAKPQYRQVRAADLKDQLLGLPMSAWPRGPVITISPSDDVSDPKAVRQNFSAAQEVCRSLGLEVQIRRGG
jgi:hypothetical protein